MIGGDIAQATCSRAGCVERATWQLEWRNPRLHAEGRVKTWLACDEHVAFLSDFLAARDFPLTVAPYSAEQPA